MRCLFPLLLLAACAPAEPPLLIDESRKAETVADDKPARTDRTASLTTGN